MIDTMECPGCLGQGQAKVSNELIKCPICEGEGEVTTSRLIEIPYQELVEVSTIRKYGMPVKCECGNSDIVELRRGLVRCYDPFPETSQKNRRNVFKVFCPECGNRGQVLQKLNARKRNGNIVKNSKLVVEAGFVKEIV